MSTADTMRPSQADPGFLALQRASLVAKRASSMEEKERLCTAAADLLNDWGGQDGGSGDDFGEGDTAEVELDRIRALLAAISRSVEDIDAALARLDANCYGTCESCQRPIPSARLEVLPQSTHCVACKSRSGLGRVRQPSSLG